MSVTGERIRYKREALKYTQGELASLIGATQKQIWRYESGYGLPSVENLIKLANVLHTSTDWLLGLTVKDHPDLNEKEQEVVSIMRKKSPEKQDSIINIARSI